MEAASPPERPVSAGHARVLTGASPRNDGGENPTSKVRAMTSPAPLRAAIVGAGPSGFYAADQLLKEGFDVDL